MNMTFIHNASFFLLGFLVHFIFRTTFLNEKLYTVPEFQQTLLTTNETNTDITTQVICMYRTKVKTWNKRQSLSQTQNKMICNRKNKWKQKEIWVERSPNHVTPLPPMKSIKSVISSSSRASFASSGASAGASPAWASDQSPGHATFALIWSGVWHGKEVNPCLCMLRLI